MSKEVKIVLAIFGSLAAIVVIGIVAFVLALPHLVKSFAASSADPVAAKATAEKIATFTIPKGYVIRDAANAGITQIVTIVPAARGRHSFQMQLQGSVVASQTSNGQSMKLAMGLMNGFIHCDPRDAGVDTVTVRGVAVKLSVLQCGNAAFPMRIESGTFPGNANMATITAMGVQGRDFDTAALHALLQSVR